MINNKQGKVKLGVLVWADIEAAEGTSHIPYGSRLMTDI